MIDLMPLFSVWAHVSADKQAIVVETAEGHVGVVYDRIEDPRGPGEQYGIQRLPWPEFWRTHQLKHDSCGQWLSSSVR
jgi:hypothetical protein